MSVVIQGTCGWSDQTLLDCKRFYPFNVKSSVEKLRYYSRCGNFGCVEVDSSTYNIPTSSTVSKWVDSTPNGFKFHFKAFGFLVNGGGKASTLPNEIRSKYSLNSHGNKDKYLSIDSIGDAAASAIWKYFHDSLQPAQLAGKLGVVVFQFQLNILPCESSRRYIEYCAKNLDSSIHMGIEFRNRKWFDGLELNRTRHWLSTLRSENNVALICCDDLEHELYQKDSEQCGLPPGKSLVHLPIYFSHSRGSKFMYVRVHRRFGNNRVLSESEIQAWATRILSLDEREEVSYDRCPIYFLWGTDHEDQPIINAKNLAQALPHDFLPSFPLDIAKSARPTLSAGIVAAFARQKETPFSEEKAGATADSNKRKLNGEHSTATHSSPKRSKVDSVVAEANDSSIGNTSESGGKKVSTIMSFFKPIK
eukprot:gene22790-31086_t